MVVKWVVFYSDGIVLTSAQYKWHGIPITGAVIAVWWDDKNIRHLECGDDALVHTGNEIVGVNLPTDNLLRAANTDASEGTLKYGVYMNPSEWAEIRETAENLREFPE